LSRLDIRARRDAAPMSSTTVRQFATPIVREIPRPLSSSARPRRLSGASTLAHPTW
jgi:hypothetical protein